MAGCWRYEQGGRRKERLVWNSKHSSLSKVILMFLRRFKKVAVSWSTCSEQSKGRDKETLSELASVRFRLARLLLRAGLEMPRVVSALVLMDLAPL